MKILKITLELKNLETKIEAYNNLVEKLEYQGINSKFEYDELRKLYAKRDDLLNLDIEKWHKTALSLIEKWPEWKQNLFKEYIVEPQNAKKVKCISTRGPGIEYVNITLGKIYEVEDYNDFHDKTPVYMVLNDEGERLYYRAYCFEVVE